MTPSNIRENALGATALAEALSEAARTAMGADHPDLARRLHNASSKARALGVELDALLRNPTGD